MPAHSSIHTGRKSHQLLVSLIVFFRFHRNSVSYADLASGDPRLPDDLFPTALRDLQARFTKGFDTSIISDSRAESAGIPQPGDGEGRLGRHISPMQQYRPMDLATEFSNDFVGHESELPDQDSTQESATPFAVSNVSSSYGQYIPSLNPLSRIESSRPSIVLHFDFH